MGYEIRVLMQTQCTHAAIYNLPVMVANAENKSDYTHTQSEITCTDNDTSINKPLLLIKMTASFL